MSAKVESFYSKKRVPLHEVIPLDMPFTLHIELSSGCDLRCKFCAHSSADFLNKKGHVKVNMSDETFNLLLAQIKELPHKLKTIWLSGLGEALLHPNLPSMIAQLKKNNITEKIAIITNGVRLSHTLSKSLVEAGLDSMAISVNGLSADDYLENCGVKIDFDKYLSEISFLYSIKGDMQLNIKIVDAFVRDEDKKKKFFETFEKYCDKINIERIFPRYGDFNYEGLIENEDQKSRYEEITRHPKICAASFFRMFVNSLGKVNCCGYPDGVASSDMDIHMKSLIEIWNSEEHKKIMLNSLSEKHEGITQICASCGSRDCYAFNEDNLDSYAEELYERILAQ